MTVIHVDFLKIFAFCKEEIMGAIWDFISGKSTDWDAVVEEENRKDAARQRREMSRPRRIEYKAYCRICGYGDYGYMYSTPQEAIRKLQEYCDNGCGKGNHVPQIQEIER